MGHRDSGQVTIDDPNTNDGNFRAVLLMRVRAGDVALGGHFQQGSGNASHKFKMNYLMLLVTPEGICAERHQASQSLIATGRRNC